MQRLFWLLLICCLVLVDNVRAKEPGANCPSTWGSRELLKQTTESLRVLYDSQQGAATDCGFIVGWELSVRLAWERRQAEREAILNGLENYCIAGGVLSKRQRAGCAFVIGEKLKTPDLWTEFRKRRQWREFATVVSSLENEAERIWVRATVERTAPMLERATWKEALVALEWMQRGSSFSEGAWWKADTLEAQGNAALARKTRAEAISQSEFFSRVPVSRWRKAADGVCRGWQPVFRAGPWNGLALGASYCEENRYGKEQGVGLRATAATRGNFIGRGSIFDVSLLKPWRIRLASSVSRVIEDFYGVGMDSSPTRTSWPTSRIDSTIAVDIPFRADAFGFFASVGFRVMGIESEIPASVTLPTPVAGVVGPVFDLTVDELDSEFFAKSGWRISSLGFLGLRPALFFRQQLSILAVAPWTVRFRTKLSVEAILNFGQAPFHEWPVMMGSIWMPAVRPYRFINKNVWGGSVFQEWDVIRNLTLAPAVSVASSSSSGLSSIDSWKAGASMGVIWFFSPERRWHVRADGGIFSGNLALQAGAELPF